MTVSSESWSCIEDCGFPKPVEVATVTDAVVVVAATVVVGSGNLERRESYANSTHARPSKKGFARVETLAREPGSV